MWQIQNRNLRSGEVQNETAKLELHKLTTEQLYMFDYQLYPLTETNYPFTAY